MEVIRHPQELGRQMDSLRKSGKSVGIVPTMGALHAGHYRLFEYGRRGCAILVVSIFVNPIQFNQSSDLENYPRTWEEDLKLCEEAGVDFIYAPAVETMYPEGFQSKLSLTEITMPMEGASRPGHFDGVATVVAKLFNASRADYAWFGEKDFQQLKMLSQMVKDMDMGVRIMAVPTVREADGLALSSRNRRLNDKQRQSALSLSRALQAMIAEAKTGQRQVEALLRTGRRQLDDAVILEYLEIMDDVSLTKISTLTGNARALIAAQVGPVRLIDNMDISI